MPPAASSSTTAPSGAVRRLEIPGTGAVAFVTTRRAGDLRPDSPGAPARQAAAVAGVAAWRSVRQEHGARVVGDERAGEEADGLVTTRPGVPLAMFAADCALVALASPSGPVGVVHAGWPGLLAGVIEEGAAALRRLGADELFALVGPSIGPECYEFGASDLDRVAAVYGPSVRSVTTSGRPALDLAEGVRVAARRAGVTVALEIGECTACTTSGGVPGYFSHRVRRDSGRHALVVVAT